jgi:hypothetical protein
MTAIASYIVMNAQLLMLVECCRDKGAPDSLHIGLGWL